MKKLLLLFTTLLFISCSSEDDNNNVENQTFLERFDGVGFTDGGEYFYFFNDDVFLKYITVDDDGLDCWELREGSNSIDGDEITVRIFTNKYDSLKIAITFIDAEETDNIEFIPNSNSLTVVDEGDMEDTYQVDKTTTTYSSLCN